MTDQSLSKTILSTNKSFVLPKEFSILNELEGIPADQPISSRDLIKFGMLNAGHRIADQISIWDIPIKESKPINGFGESFIFERNSVIDVLGKSYLVPLKFLRGVFEMPKNNSGVSSWAKKNGLTLSNFGNSAYCIRGEVKRLVTKPIPDPKLTAPQPLALDLQSPPPAVPDGDPLNHSHGPIIETDNHVPPPQLPVMDLAPRCAPLVTTLDEVNLALLKQTRDIQERCEYLLKEVKESQELLSKQNRHIFKSLENLLKEFA
jgi:hypothetical protein